MNPWIEYRLPSNSALVTDACGRRFRAFTARHNADVRHARTGIPLGLSQVRAGQRAEYSLMRVLQVRRGRVRRGDRAGSWRTEPNFGGISLVRKGSWLDYIRLGSSLAVVSRPRMPNSALLTDAYSSPLRAQHGAAKRER